MRIVRADLKHLEILATLFDGYRQFYEQAPNLEAARDFIKERLENDESVIFLALDENDTGMGFTQLYPIFSSVSLRTMWLLNDLFVAATARQHGVGAALLERARDHALETRAKGLMLQTAITNSPAQRLYERLGWVRDAEFYVYNLTL